MQMGLLTPALHAEFAANWRQELQPASVGAPDPPEPTAAAAGCPKPRCPALSGTTLLLRCPAGMHDATGCDLHCKYACQHTSHAQMHACFGLSCAQEVSLGIEKKT